MTDNEIVELILKSDNPRKIIREASRIIGPGSRKPRKMCGQGLHKLTPENTYVTPGSGSRICRRCKTIRERKDWKEGGAAEKRRTKKNTETLIHAHRHNYIWTGPELEIASREDLTSRQVADMLGRTLFSVKTARHKLRNDPGREILLAGTNKK